MEINNNELSRKELYSWDEKKRDLLKEANTALQNKIQRLENEIKNLKIEIEQYKLAKKEKNKKINVLKGMLSDLDDDIKTNLRGLKEIK